MVSRLGLIPQAAILLTAFSLGGWMCGVAQQVQPDSMHHLTLVEAIKQAQTNEPVFASALAAQKSARIEGYLAKATILPSVTYHNQMLYTQPNGKTNQGGQVGSQASPIFIANNAVHEYSSQAVVNETIGLKQLADAQVASATAARATAELPPQNEIRRENLQRMVVVTAQLQGSDLGTAIAKVQRTVNAMHLPSSVRVVYGGTYQEQQKSFSELLQVLLISLALVFGVLLVEFRNFSAPIAILTSSVLSVGGVVLALLVTGTTFNVASFMGVIMVIGIVAKNGILLLDADEQYRRTGTSAKDAMLHAAQRRLRPIVMTATAAICGMLPLAFALGAGSQMLQPLAIAVIGGLVISMVLSLIVTPVIYYLLTSRRHDPPGEEVAAS